MTDEERQQLIDDAIADPQSTTFDGLTVQNRDLAQLREVVGQQQATEGAAKPHRGIRFSKLIPRGANG